MDGEQVAERLGELRENVKHISARVDEIGDRLDAHVDREEDRLKHIEQQMSLGRFLFLTAKTIILTIAALLAFKFGDISGLWRALIK